MKLNFFPTPLLNYKERGTKLEVTGKEKVADRDAYVLTVTPASGPVSRVYIDAQSYLPVKSITTVEIPEVGPVEQTTELSDHRAVDGVQVPFTVKGSSSVQTFTITVTKVEHNVKIDDALFAKPAGK
jgi:outer membrane lipoprotein-sorting protein